MDKIPISKNITVPVVKKLFKNAGRVIGMVWNEKRRDVILLVFVYLLASAVPFLSSGSLGYLINVLVQHIGATTLPSDIFWALVLFVAANIFPALLYTFQNYISQLFWFFLQEKFDLLILKKKAELDIATHEDPVHSNLLNRVTEGGMSKAQNFVDRQFYIFQNIAEVVIAAVIILAFKWWIFILIVIGTVPELILEAKIGQDAWDLFGKRAEARRKLWEYRRGFDYVEYLMETKISQNIGHFIHLIQELFRGILHERRDVEQAQLWRRFVVQSVSYCVIAFTLVWFVFEVIHGNILIGTLTFALTSVRSLRQSLSSLSSNLGRWYEESLFMSDVFAFLDLRPRILISDRAMQLPRGTTPEIVFDNVSFRYPGSEKDVLKNFSLTVQPGEKIAFVGANGSGKTTVVKLLCRFYDPTEGVIRVGGHDLRTIDIESWYSHVGALFQDYPNYRLIVRDMIGLGRTTEKFSFNKMKDAAKASEADAFIDAWEKKYDQMLGKRFTGGIEPSGGQWQKLALARTFYRDPSVLILDEPTAAVDAESEAKIFAKLQSLPSDHTVFLISHRFSTVRQADRIAVIEGGSILELGTHEQLLKKRGGTYARLFKLQAKGYQ